MGGLFVIVIIWRKEERRLRMIARLTAHRPAEITKKTFRGVGATVALA